MADSELEIKLLGELTVVANGEVVALPQSKKTRALLAYLLLNAGRHSREHLCEMFWDLPDDPRGSLRWSLSKLRPILNQGDTVRLVTSRDHVAVEHGAVRVDVLEAMAAAESGLEDLSDTALGTLAHLFTGKFLDGLQLSGQGAFENWRAAEQDSAWSLHCRVLEALIARHKSDPAARATWLRDRKSTCLNSSHAK